MAVAVQCVEWNFRILSELRLQPAYRTVYLQYTGTTGTGTGTGTTGTGGTPDDYAPLTPSATLRPTQAASE